MDGTMILDILEHDLTLILYPETPINSPNMLYICSQGVYVSNPCFCWCPCKDINVLVRTDLLCSSHTHTYWHAVISS